MPLTDPVPSSAFDVLERNVQDTDKFVNQETGTFTNRVGKEIKPIPVIEAEAKASVDSLISEITNLGLQAVESVGWIPVGEFATGFTYTKLNDVGRDESGSWWRYNGSDLPKVITAGTVPSSPNFSVISFETANNVEWKIGKSVGYSLDDLQGFTDELLAEAGIVPSGQPDKLGASQRVDAIKKLAARANIRNLGVVGDGIADDSDTFVAALASNPFVIIDEFTTVRITKHIYLDPKSGFVCGGGRIYLDGQTARIRSDEYKLTVASTLTGLAFDNGTLEIGLGGDYTGKYVYITNNLSWFIKDASLPGTPAGSMDPFSYTANDNDFRTERSGLYKVVGHNSANGKSILNMPTNFNATNATATVYDDAHHVQFDNIHFSHSPHTYLYEYGSIALSFCYGAGFRNCTFNNTASIGFHINNTRCYFDGNDVQTYGGVWIAFNSRQCIVSNNRVSHTEGEGDSAIIMYYNACENTISGNTVTTVRPIGPHSRWGVMTHSASDNNTITGNVITSPAGISDFMTCKGNVFSGNTVNGQNEVIAYYSFGANIIGNTFNDIDGLTIDGSILANITGNLFRQRANITKGLVSIYDPHRKPFDFEGFTLAYANTLNFENNTVVGSGKKVAVRDYIIANGSGGNDFNCTAYANAANICIGATVTSIDNVNIRNNHISGFDAVVLNYNENVTTGRSEITSRGNIFEDCDVMIAQSSWDPTKLGIFTSSSDTLKNVSIAGVTSTAPLYIRGMLAAEIDSVVAVCGNYNFLYAAIIDVDCLFDNETKLFNYYDFSGKWAYYQQGVIEAGRHWLAANLPYGAQYYQISDNMHTAQSSLFINKLNGTVKRTITEQQYN